MHCGNASSFNSESSADIQKDVWAESYNCSSDTKSLFDCEKNNLTTRNTIATVNCSGNVTGLIFKWKPLFIMAIIYYYVTGCGPVWNNLLMQVCKQPPHPFSCLPRQKNSKWSWAKAAGGMSVFVWTERSVEVCAQTPGCRKGLRCCVKTWAVGTETWHQSPSLEKVRPSSQVCTVQTRRPTWPSATSSGMKMISAVNKPMLFAQVMGCF